MNDSGEFQEIESNCSGNILTVPVKPAVVPNPRSMLSRDKRLPLDAWNLSEPQGNVLSNPRPMFESFTDTLTRNSSRNEEETLFFFQFFNCLIFNF